MTIRNLKQIHASPRAMKGYTHQKNHDHIKTMTHHQDINKNWRMANKGAQDMISKQTRRIGWTDQTKFRRSQAHPTHHYLQPIVRPELIGMTKILKYVRHTIEMVHLKKAHWSIRISCNLQVNQLTSWNRRPSSRQKSMRFVSSLTTIPFVICPQFKVRKQLPREEVPAREHQKGRRNRGALLLSPTSHSWPTSYRRLIKRSNLIPPRGNKMPYEGIYRSMGIKDRATATSSQLNKPSRHLLSNASPRRSKYRLWRCHLVQTGDSYTSCQARSLIEFGHR